MKSKMYSMYLKNLLKSTTKNMNSILITKNSKISMMKFMMSKLLPKNSKNLHGMLNTKLLSKKSSIANLLTPSTEEWTPSKRVLKAKP